MRDGILTHTGEQEPETLEGKIVRIVDRVAYINHDIDDAIRYGILEEGDLPRDEIAILGPTGSKRIDTLVHDLVETSAREGDIVQSDEIGGAMLSLRAFMFERVYLGPETRAEHERARATVRRIFDAARRPRRRARRDHRVHRRHDRPLRARIRCAASDGADQGHDRRGGQAGRRLRRRRRGAHAAAQGGRAARRPLPVPRGAHAELLGQPGRQALLLLRLPQGRRHDHVRPRDAGPRLRRRDRVARRPLPASRSSTRSPRPTRTRAARAASGCSRCSTTAATFYERYLWDSQAGSFARDYLAGRGLGEEICREFRLGLALGGTTLTRKALEKGFTAEELRAAGLTRQRGGDYFERRLVFPLADARGRVLGFQARRLHDDDPLQAKYVNTPESELFTKGAVVYGLDKSRADDRAARTAPASSRATPT